MSLAQLLTERVKIRYFRQLENSSAI